MYVIKEEEIDLSNMKNSEAFTRNDNSYKIAQSEMPGIKFLRLIENIYSIK